MSASGEYRNLWLMLKQKRKLRRKPESITRKQMMRAISKEKNEDSDPENFFVRLTSSEEWDANGVHTGFYWIELVEVANKTRKTALDKMLEGLDI